MSTVVTVFQNGTNVRRGGSTQGPNNVMGSIDKGSYNALVQMAGGEVVQGSTRNFWWVLLETPVGTGWVSAVRIDSGGNDQPIPNVHQAPTTFCWD